MAGRRRCPLRDGRPLPPHQWSHLPAEAVVDGSELVCTTHFWRYDRSGAGWKQAFSGRRDRKGDIVVYPCREEGSRIQAQLPPA